ncbi:hypothetical protein Q3G72_028589 [Acer saccharum]|nr:hypothetical protein Q3G72_028589 [Acer saccharum]
MTRKGTSADDLFLLFDNLVTEGLVNREALFLFATRRVVDGIMEERLWFNSPIIRGRYRKLIQRREAGREAAALVQGDGSFLEYAYEFRFKMCILKINRSVLWTFSAMTGYIFSDIRMNTGTRDTRKRSSRSRDRHNRDKYRGKERDHRHRSMSRSASPDRHKYHGRDRYDEERRSRSRSYGRNDGAAYHVVAICLE